MVTRRSESNQHGPDVDEASLGLLAALRKAGAKAFRPIGCTPMEAMVLVFIRRGISKPTDLGRLLGVVSPGLSTLTTKMAEAGLLTKETVKGDHRQVRLKLTDQGERAYQHVRAAWATHSPINTSSFTEEEISTHIRVSEKLLQLPES